MAVKIPKASAKRLPLYRRCFVALHKKGIERVLSHELGDHLSIDAATIRRDFSYIGVLGRQGYGYEVPKMLEALNEFLGINNVTSAALVGVGNLGKAFLKFNNSRNDRDNDTYNTPVVIDVAFDVAENIVGESIDGVKVYHTDELEKIISENNIKIAILSVPADAANKIAFRLENSGIVGIYNFSSVSLNVSKHIYVHDVDLLNELQTFVYFVNINN